MADPGPRDAYLAEVARALDAAPEVQDDVLAELAGHVDDEAAAGVARGLDPATAERRALDGLGDPRALGVELRRARRSRRAALALAGGGVVALGGYSLFGIAIGMLALLAAGRLAGLLGAATGGFGPVNVPGSYAGLTAVAIALTYAFHVTPAVLSPRSAWSIGFVRRALAFAAIVVGVPVAVLLPGQELDTWLALAYPLVPLAVAAAALRGPAAPPVLRPGAVTLATGAILLALPLAAWPSDPAASPSPSVEPVNAAVLGRPAPEIPTAVFPVSSTAWASGGKSALTTGIIFDDTAGSRDLAVEVWALERGLDGAWRYAPGPLLRVPYTIDGNVALATVLLPRPRAPTWAARASTFIAADGVRSVYGGALIERLPPWTGSVLDWWSGR